MLQPRELSIINSCSLNVHECKLNVCPKMLQPAHSMNRLSVLARISVGLDE